MIQHFRLKNRSGSGSNPDPGFWWPKIKKFTADKKCVIFWLKKIATYLFLGLYKGRPSSRRSFQPSEENIQHFKTWTFLTFFIFVGHFPPPPHDPDPHPLTLLNPDQVRIRIGIRSTDHTSTHMLCVDKNILYPEFNTFLDFSFFVFYFMEVRWIIHQGERIALRRVFFYLRIRIYHIHRMWVHTTVTVQASDLTHRSVSMSDVLGEPFRTPQNVKPFNRYGILFFSWLLSLLLYLATGSTVPVPGSHSVSNTLF